MSSISGFANKELFEELEKILLASDESHKDPKEWERGMRVISELVCTPRQIIPLLVFFVHFISKYLYVFDTDVWNAISHSLKNSIDAFESNTDESMTHCLCHYLAKLFVICALCPKKQHADFFKRVAYLEYVQPQIESLTYENWLIVGFDRYIQTSHEDGLTTLGKKKMCVFLFALERRNKTLLHAVLHDLLSPGSCYVQTSRYDTVNKDKDILWLVWNGFLRYVHLKCKDKGTVKWVRNMCALSKFQYRKDKRKQRIHLLLISLRIFLEADRSDAEQYMAKIKYALPSIEIDMKNMVDEISEAVAIASVTHETKSTTSRKKCVRKKKQVKKNDETEDDELPEYLNFIPLRL